MGDLTGVAEDALHSADAAAERSSVVSRLPPETAKVGSLFATPAVMGFAQSIFAVTWLYGVFFVPASSARMVGLPRPTTLMYLGDYLLAFSMPALLLPIFAIARVTQEKGDLAVLGAGTVEISAADAKSLARWRVVIGGFGSCACVAGCGWIGASIQHVTGMKHVYWVEAHLLWGLPIAPVCQGIMFIVIGAGVTCGFWGSMRLASALARNSVTDVMKAARATSPLDDEAWERDVRAPALALDETMRVLSRGWGRGLFGMTFTFWMFSLARFMAAIDRLRCAGMDAAGGKEPGTSRNTNLAWVCFTSIVPLLLALDLANTSSQCDELLGVLNAARVKHGPTVHEKIAYLEACLRNLNRGQGLGFKVAAVVVDRRFLKQLSVALAGGLTTVISLLLALSETAAAPSAAAADGMICGAELQAVAAAALKATVMGRNVTCAFNTTIDEALAA